MKGTKTFLAQKIFRVFAIWDALKYKFFANHDDVEYIADPNRIVYSLNVEDLQTIADQDLGRELSEKEIQKVENRVGDYISWDEAISASIIDVVTNEDDL